jgi:hypothetical protein
MTKPERVPRMSLGQMGGRSSMASRYINFVRKQVTCESMSGVPSNAGRVIAVCTMLRTRGPEFFTVHRSGLLARRVNLSP